MKELVKDLEREFSTIERDIIEDFQEEKALANITARGITSEIILKDQEFRYTFRVNCVEGEKRTVSLEFIVRDVPTNHKFFYADNPLELNQIIRQFI